MARQHIVFLDRDSLPVPIRRPDCAASYTEHAATSEAEALERLREATVAITNKVPLRAPVLRRLAALRMIAVAATGYDMVDIEACRELGIVVSNVRNYAVHAVPEHVFMLILALRRQLLAYRADVQSGAWQRAAQFCLLDHPIADLHGSTLGIVGWGAIGRATAALGAAFGMRILRARRTGTAAAGAEATDSAHTLLPLEDLLALADVVSLHCPLNEQTRAMIGEPQLRRMKPGALLINTARGGLVDEAALVRALEEAWIGGAGFDVLGTEPPRDGNPLLELRRHDFILTPHVAWGSAGALRELAAQLADNIDAWDRGEARHRVA